MRRLLLSAVVFFLDPSPRRRSRSSSSARARAQPSCRPSRAAAAASRIDTAMSTPSPRRW